MNSKISLVVISLFFLLFSPALAEVPRVINYQGKITTPQGALIDTTISMTFAIYTDSIGIDSVWSETQSSVVVEKGIFSVLLGSVNSIQDSVFTGEIRYLGIKAGDDAEMTPRKAIVSVGYSFDSDKVDGFDVSTQPEPGQLLPLDSTGVFPKASIPAPNIQVFQDTADVEVDSVEPALFTLKTDTIEASTYSEGFFVFATGDAHFHSGGIQIYLYIDNVQKEWLRQNVSFSSGANGDIPWILMRWIGKEDPDWNPEEDIILTMKMYISANMGMGRCHNWIVWGF